MPPTAEDALLGIRLFGGYIVIRKLGEGGMGAVYIAEDAELDKRIAAKVLLPEWSRNEQIVARFAAEARAASAIRHENIIDIIAKDRLPDGRHYIAMEFLEGRSLQGFCEQWGPLAVDQAVTILAQICSGLDAAHEKGIVHRDLKPDNVFVTNRPGQPWFVKILDFGIAKLGGGMAPVVRTGTNAVAGTPAYMAPEQARGMRGVDARADIFALGAIAYQMFTTRLPFRGDSLGDIVHAQLMEPVADPRQIRPDLPANVAATILAALAYDRDKRPPTMREFLRGLIADNPDLERIARSAAPTLFLLAGHDDATARAPQSAAPPTISLGPPPAAAKPTTLSSAVGQATAHLSPPPTSARRSRTMIAAGVGIAMVGAIVAVIMWRSGSGDDDAETTSSAAEAAEVVPTPESRIAVPLAVLARVPVTIRATPASAAISVDGRFVGNSGVTLDLPTTARVSVKVSAPGHVSREVAHDVVPGGPLLLVRLDPEPPPATSPPAVGVAGQRKHRQGQARGGRKPKQPDGQVVLPSDPDDVAE